MQYHPMHLNDSKFGKSKTIFESHVSDNQNLAEQFMNKIDPKFKSIINYTCFSNSHKKFSIYSKVFGEVFYPLDKTFYQSFLVIGIAIEFGSFRSKTNDHYNCISIIYIGDNVRPLLINMKTLMPDFEIRIFIDFESVVFAINKILQEIFYKSMIDRMSSQRIPLLLYREAIMREKKNKRLERRSSIVFGSKGRKDILQKIASFLGDSDIGDCF